MANWAQIFLRKESSSHFYTGTSQLTALHGEAAMELSVHSVFLPSEPALKNISWNPVSSDKFEASHPIRAVQLWPIKVALF